MEESSLGALPGPLRLFGVEEQLAVDDVADAPLEGPERFLFRLAFLNLAVEERASRGVRVTDLGDGRDVDGVVQLPVAASGESLHDPAAGGDVDGGGAVVGGVVTLAAEPVDVAGVADEHAGHHRTDSEQLGEGRAGGGDGGSDSAFRLRHLSVEAAEIVEMLPRKRVAGHRDRTGGGDVGEELFGAGSVDFIGDSTGNEFGQEGMEAAGCPVPGTT